MIKKVLLGLIAIVVLICAIASFQSDDMNVTRSATIAAPPGAVFKVVNDFRQWDAWSPWSKLDPNMTKTLEGPPEGVGAVYHWNGNNEVGEGTTRLIESKPNEKIGMKLMGLFMDCEKMCGDQFNEGLANLGKVATTAPKP